MTRVFGHYDVLGVSPAASVDEILDAENALRRHFQSRAQRGDTEATETLRRLDEARRVLLDEAQRATYDRDPAALARSYVDVAHPLPIGRYAKLAQLDEWLGEQAPRLHFEDWAAYDALLDEEHR